PKRVAVISSASAAGYGDFCDQLNGNLYGFNFRVQLFPAPMQGSRVEEGIISALNAIARDIDSWDVVVIIRGGGATSDLSCFDTYDLANNCAQFPLPVVTGIGHQRDDTLLDIVAHTRVKTPTAAAELLIHTMLVQAEKIENLRRAIPDTVSRRIADERRRVEMLVQNLPLSVAMVLQQQRHKLDIWEQQLQASSPDRILAKGYTLTLSGGRIVRSAAELSAGDEVVTRFADGDVTSTVKNIK
ncbi:MAG: exodeoxyribonuclease VII large subunit, partial [Bacteroidaceae bacterium]|nr:exodeoxyribonuclease VII large subunit [Bacteroidaceae bacterium]